jgi:branched-chain amino acid aminotransferase
MLMLRRALPRRSNGFAAAAAGGQLDASKATVLLLRSAVPRRGVVSYVAAAAAAGGQLAAGELDARKLTVTRRATPGVVPPNAALLGKFGKIFSDHMLVVDWTAEKGWGAPSIEPYGDLAMSPAAMCLHYGLQCFEGMKAYKGRQQG